jgi:hypothetical protein
MSGFTTLNPRLFKITVSRMKSIKTDQIGHIPMLLLLGTE